MKQTNLILKAFKLTKRKIEENLTNIYVKILKILASII